TRVNLKSIGGKWITQWKAVTDKARKEAIPAGLQSDILTLSGAPSLVDGRARDKYIEYRLAQAFPTSFSEALNNYQGMASLTPWAAYVTYLGKLGITAANVGSNPTPPGGQQSVMLFLALTIGPQDTGATADSWAVTAVGRLTVSTPGPPAGTAKVDGFMDAWDRPILFTRNYNGAPALASGGRNKKYGNNPYDNTKDS